MEPFLLKFFPSVYHEQKEQVVTNQYCKYESHLLTLFTSSLFLAAAIASFLAYIVTASCGRKWTMFAGGFTFLVGASINGAAVNLPMLLVGRVLLGIGVGFCVQAVPLYLSEMSPARLRGMVNIGFQLMITVGILAANLINYGTCRIKGGWGWRVSLALAGVPAATIALGSLALPDTPNSLIQRGQPEKARETLARVRGTEDVQCEFDDLVSASEECRAMEQQHNAWRNMFERKYRPQLIMALLIPFFQQLTGINVIMFYAPVLFKTIGFGEDATFVSAVITGLVNMLSTFVSIVTVDKAGRKALFIQGGTQMIVSQFLVGTFIAIEFGASGVGEISEQYAMCIVLFVCVYVAGFAWSWGPLGWLIPSEIFPLEIRSAAQSITVSINMLFTFFIGQIFLTLLCSMKFGLFYFFGGWVLLMTAFVAAFLPETKNVPLEDMMLVWRRHWFWKTFVREEDVRVSNAEKRKRIPIQY